MTKILTPTGEYDVAAHDGLWMSPVDAERITGWTLKPEGMCRDDLCVPLPASALGSNEVDLEAFWEKLGGPVVGSATRDVWALGASAGERNAALEGLEAPDFTLPDLEGVPRSLSQLRGRKVFLATWASW
ncbi:MAG: redoxin domain-containing protein [Rhodospirillaceae bacterium]|nr:MAG: redoxin domain-containing protein [Rhodospirillaceae bacterium]